MNIYVELNKIIEYVEKHLEDKIEYKELAKMIGVNEYTFQKIFSVLCEITLAEYIRNRRLSSAGQDIYLKDEKIIDVATRYQYDNATAFSRAFEKFHGIKPSGVKKNPEKLKLYAKLHFNETQNTVKNIEYKIVEIENLILYGRYKLTDNEKIKKDAPSFYNENNIIYGEPQYGMVEYNESERLDVKEYWILYSEPKKGLVKKVIPKSKWILIRINSQNPIDIQETSRIFYYEFLPSCKYNIKDLPEIEYYHDGITDFLIPIEN